MAAMFYNLKKYRICVEKIMTAIPLLKPTIKERGIYFNNVPKRNAPIANMIIAAINVAMVTMPYF